MSDDVTHSFALKIEYAGFLFIPRTPVNCHDACIKSSAKMQLDAYTVESDYTPIAIFSIIKKRMKSMFILNFPVLPDNFFNRK